MAYTTRDDWTPPRIKSARRAAETGNLTLAADLIENMMSDDRMIGVMSTRTRGLIKSTVYFQAHEGEDATPESQALSEDFWTAYPESALDELITWGTILGIGIAEHRWQIDEDTGRILPKLHVWSPRWLRYDHGAEAWKLRTRDAGEIIITPGDGKWVFYTPYGAHRPWQRGLWRAIAPWWLLKRYALLDWGSYSEAHGNPTRVGTTPEGATKDERIELATDLENLAGITGLALPPGFDYKLIEATANTYQTFQKQMDSANKAMSITIAGQNLTSDVEGGSYAAAKVHENIRHDIIESDEQTISTTLHAQSIKWWTAYNFGDDDRAPWARWDVTPPDGELPEYMLKYGTVTINEARGRVGLEPLKDGDRLIEAPAGAVPAEPFTGRADLAQIRLASGATGSAAPGFIRGQMYVDRMIGRHNPLPVLQKNLSDLTAFINSAGSYNEIIEGLPRLLDDMDPDDANALMEALILADLAGRKAVHEDL